MYEVVPVCFKTYCFSDVSLEFIGASQMYHWSSLVLLRCITGAAAGREVGIQVMAEMCQIVLDRFGMPVFWTLGIVVSIFNGKGDIRNCSCSRGMELLEH